MNERHPSEADLALLSGGDCGRWQTFHLNRHIARCADCSDKLVSFRQIRSEAIQFGADRTLPEPAWNRLAADMRANISLGLAAGDCVRPPLPGEGSQSGFRPGRLHRLPRFAIGAAAVILTTAVLSAGAAIFLRSLLPHENAPGTIHPAVLESTGAGVQLRTDSGSMTLLNHGDVPGDQTVTSQGAIRASYVDGNTGTVTVTSVDVE